MDIVKFEWDEKKNQTNIEDHGVSFRKASTVFSDENAVIADDVNHSFDEDGFLIIGRSYDKDVLFVCFCIRNGDTVRLISARKANKKEREVYEANV